MRGYDIPYSSRELAWIKKHRAMPRRDAHAVFSEKFHRDDVSLNNFNALCTRHGWTTGRTGCFPKGYRPHNLGQKMPYNANSARTQYKTGNAPHNTRYLGHERLSKDGYVEISIAETNPYTGFWRRYVLKHRHLWERRHGLLPAGHVLKSLDGNRLNADPSNWVSIPRSALPFLNGRWGSCYDQAAPEIKPAILMLAKLRAARAKKSRGGR